jgi:hypothetical protein
MQPTELQETSKREDARRLALHVWFLAGGDGLAAHLAARWAKFLTNGCLEVKAAGPGGTDLSAALNCVPADLVVVIHTSAAPGPLVANNCGGRIDWDLEVDATGSPFELASQVRRHVMRLLGDLGMAQAHSDVSAEYSSCPSMALEHPNRLDARASLLAA